MTEKIITDVTARRCKEQFLKFVDDLSNKYPPMTFQEYRDADGNHMNWFPQQYQQTTSSMYREWFTLAVLNNRKFIMLVYKRCYHDAVNIFTEIINSVDFRNFIHPFDDYCNTEIISRCVKLPIIIGDDGEEIIDESDSVEINYSWDFDISQLIEYYNVIFQYGNINTVSSKIQICNTIKDLKTLSTKKLNGDELEVPETRKVIFIYDVKSKKISIVYPLITYDIDNIYAFQILSNSTILFKCLAPGDIDYDEYKEYVKKLKPAEVFPTLFEIIVDILK